MGPRTALKGCGTGHQRGTCKEKVTQRTTPSHPSPRAACGARHHPTSSACSSPQRDGQGGARPFSTGRGTRRVRLVRGGGGAGRGARASEPTSRRSAGSRPYMASPGRMRAASLTCARLQRAKQERRHARGRGQLCRGPIAVSGRCSQYGERDKTCPVSTGRGTRRVRLVRGGRGEGRLVSLCRSPRHRARSRPPPPSLLLPLPVSLLYTHSLPTRTARVPAQRPAVGRAGDQAQLGGLREKGSNVRPREEQGLREPAHKESARGAAG